VAGLRRLSPQPARNLRRNATPNREKREIETIEGALIIDLLLAYYGDDFTGATDVMESLTYGGVETVLFVHPPTDEAIRRYPHARALGIAGSSRAMSPQEMDASLPDVFHRLVRYRPRIVHYKICSTFDSSPQLGSIGRAIDIGCGIFRNRFVPLVVGVTALQRFCVFGNLFARSGLDSPPYRLDRHPAMRQHIVTPMAEADLRVHLSYQTNRHVGLIDVLTLESGYDRAAAHVSQLAVNDQPIVLFDTLTDQHLATIGRLIWEAQQQEQKSQLVAGIGEPPALAAGSCQQPPQRPLFVAGSSGIEYSLTKHWQSAEIVRAKPETRRADPVDRTFVVSGSCSPVTDRQIAWALEHGFTEVLVDPATLLRSNRLGAAVKEMVNRINVQLEAGHSVIAHTSRSPQDDRIQAARQVAESHDSLSRRLGGILGHLLREVIRACRLRRVAVTGGDTSGHVARALGIEALEFAAPLAPGAPLSLARSRDADIDGVEITFKGGQVGHDNFFGTLLNGPPYD
jgi:uncharacterized protein YgbK (DUF1537 family)